MTNAERILACLNSHLKSRVELTLYGRAALTLGFDETPEDYALSHDVDAVLWVGQAEELNETTDFWPAVERTNAELSSHGLYVSHFFTEDQVVLLPDWRTRRVRLPERWARLDLHRLGNLDLLLSKLMRDDAIDQFDARFIVERARLRPEEVAWAIDQAVVPDSEEVQEQFRLAAKRILATF